MKLIVGLGNPGKAYEGTRHNMGFDVIDILLQRWKFVLNKKDFHSEYGKIFIDDEEVILLKPQTFMNLSGMAVLDFTSYFHIDLEDILIVYDDLDLPPGKIRIREKGSSGGQKGMESILLYMHTDEIQRIRIGIGKATMNTVDYVLGKPSPEERELIRLAQEKAADACETFVRFGFEKAKAKHS